MNRRRSIQALCGALALPLAPSLRAQAPTYNVGATPTGIPFSYLDPRTNTMQGAMIDAIRAVAADAGFNVNVVPTPFSSLIPALVMDRIDLIGAAMLVTSPRHEVIDFSDQVFSYPEGLVVNITDKSAYRSLAELTEQPVGVQTGTVYVEFVKHAGKEVKLYPSLADILREVSQGRLAAGIGDGPILAYQLAQNVSLRARLVPEYVPMLVGSVGIGMRKTDSELRKAINASLEKLRSGGTIDKIVAKWNLK